jgi:hypothetical protein
MRILNAFLALLFLAFALLQLNDPDPVLWFLIYGAMAAVCVMAMFEQYNKFLLIGLGAAFSVYSFILWPGVSVWLTKDDKTTLFSETMKMEHPYIEESREFLGLMICFIIIVYYLIRAYRKAAAPVTK